MEEETWGKQINEIEMLLFYLQTNFDCCYETESNQMHPFIQSIRASFHHYHLAKPKQTEAQTQTQTNKH